MGDFQLRLDDTERPSCVNKVEMRKSAPFMETKGKSGWFLPDKKPNKIVIPHFSIIGTLKVLIVGGSNSKGGWDIFKKSLIWGGS